MKKTTLFTCALFLLTFSQSNAQTAQRLNGNKLPTSAGNNASPQTSSDGVPVVLLGTIETPVSSREKILSYPRLIPQALGCEVTGFTFSITDGDIKGDKMWGPVTVKGAVFTEEIKDKIKEWEAPKMKILIDDIHILYNGKEMIAKPITIEYNH